jgi:hypothetical protein
VIGLVVAGLGLVHRGLAGPDERLVVKATGANKQTTGKVVRYEIAFVVDKARKEATFSADGAFVEEA